MNAYNFNTKALINSNYIAEAKTLMNFRYSKAKSYMLNESIEKKVLADPEVVEKLNDMKVDAKEFKRWVKDVKANPSKYINDPDVFEDSGLNDAQIANLRKRAKLSQKNKRLHWFVKWGGLLIAGIALPAMEYYTRGSLVSALHALLGWGVGIGALYLFNKWMQLRREKKRNNVLTKKHFEQARKLNDDPTFVKYMSGSFE